MASTPPGKVFLVGAGPGDLQLITLKGKLCLEAADVILFDELANRELLKLASDAAALTYVGKKSGQHCADQREIEALLIRHARQGKTVVRLKGGDPFVFGRGGEEALALSRAGITFEVVPGISSVVAAPAYAGIPVTHRGLASGFAVVTGHKAAQDSKKWGALAAAVDTLVILMGLQNLDGIMKGLLGGGCPPERPVALIQSGTSRHQRVLLATVASIGALAATANFQSPALIVIGNAVGLSDQLAWFDPSMDEPPWLGPHFENGFRVPV